MGSINPLKPQIDIQSYQPMLQESIQHFLIQLKSGISNYSHFNLMFTRLIQSMNSPPIEVIWFYTAVNYHTHKNMNFTHVLCLEELFNSLVSSSGSCDSVNRVAVLAPLVYELLNGLCLDNAVSKEISCFVDRLVSYISLCCCDGVDVHDESPVLSPCFIDLVKVWTVGRRRECCDFQDDFMMFFPLVSDEGRNEVWLRNEVGVLAGVVMCQVFFLNLCLKFGVQKRPHNLEQEVMLSAVDTVTGFRSCYFFDALLKMLLESSLPVTSLLTASDGVVLQEAVFDAIVLVDYPFFNPACGICLSSHHLNSLASTWLFVADRAIQFVRSNDGETKAILYMKAFTKSLIHCQLMRWVSAQIGKPDDANKPKFSTPADFLEWLVQLRGVDSHSFDNEFSLLLDKARHYKSEMTSRPPFSQAVGYKGFYLDQKVGLIDDSHGDVEMVDSTDDIKSTCKSSFSASETLRKRKGEKVEDNIRVKLLKYHLEENPLNNFSSFQPEVGFAKRS